jgi:hypothetical protein
MELDQVARELYDGAPEDFMELRKARSAEARAAGDRDLAKKITGLRRPTRSAWIVNLLSYQAADDLSALLDLGAALADAQQRLSGDDLRALSRQRNAAISGLVRRGGQLAEVRGHKPAEGTLREVSDTLQAALSDPAVADVVRQGRLTTAQAYGGFGPALAAATTAPATAEPAVPPPDAAEADQQDEQAAAEAEHQRLLDSLATAQQALDRVDGQLARIEEVYERTAEAADRRAERVVELRDQLDRAEREAAKSSADRDRLNSERDRLRRDKETAEQDVANALSQLADG